MGGGSKYMKKIKSLFSVFYLGLFLLSSLAYAMDPIEFEKTPTSKQCKDATYRYILFYEAKMKGVTRAAVIEFNQKLQTKDVIPENLIHFAYDYPDLNGSDLAMYAGLYCKSKELNFPILGLPEVAQDLAKCKNQECSSSMRNKIIGLAFNYKSEEFKPVTSYIKPLPQNNYSKRIISLESLGCTFKYPRESIINEETGTVEISFMINNQNQVKGITLIRTSGFNRLDKAIIDELATCNIKNVPKLSSSEEKFVATYIWKLD